LTFCLGEELFALESSLVLEVLEVPAITRIPPRPGIPRGRINLRGNAAPVVDVRRKFAWSPPGIQGYLRHRGGTRNSRGSGWPWAFWPTRCARSWRSRRRTCSAPRRWACPWTRPT
jgi:hypothetical protein